MEMWSTLRTGADEPCPTRKFKTANSQFAILLLLITGFFSCAHPMVTRTGGEHPTPAPTSNPSGASVRIEHESGPERAPGVELYLGSGMATGFAYQGALKALTEWKVRIVKIHAEELGALVAAAYAGGGNVNRMDWTLTKFPENSFTDKTSGLLFKGLESTESRLDKRLNETFGAAKETDFTIPVAFDSVSDPNLSLWEKIRVSLTHPPLLGPYKDLKPLEVRGDPAAAAQASPNKVIVIEARSGTDTRISETKAGQLLVIRLGIPNFADDDFKRRSQAAFYGRNQLEKLKKEIQAFLRAEDFR